MVNSKPEESADLILVNGQITTLNPSQSEATAVAIRDGRFPYVGDDQGARALGGEQATVIDLMLREQARRTPPPQWVRIVGGSRARSMPVVQPLGRIRARLRLLRLLTTGIATKHSHR